MSARDEHYLAHILEVIAAAQRFTAGGRDVFFANDMVQSTVIREIEAMGEAVRNLSAELTKREAGMPWSRIGGVRDRLTLRHVQRNSVPANASSLFWREPAPTFDCLFPVHGGDYRFASVRLKKFLARRLCAPRPCIGRP